MVDDRDDFTGQERAREAEAKLDAHNAQLSETQTGYIYTSGAKAEDTRPEMRDQKARKAEAGQFQLTALQHYLSDPQYAEAYESAQNAIAEFKERMAARLEQLEERIEALEERLEDLTSSSPEYKRLMKDREDLQRKQQDMLDYYNDTVRPIEDRMDNPDHPLSKEELETFNENVRFAMEHRFFEPPETSPGPDTSTKVQTAALEMPTL